MNTGLELFVTLFATLSATIAAAVGVWVARRRSIEMRREIEGARQRADILRYQIEHAYDDLAGAPANLVAQQVEGYRHQLRELTDALDQDLDSAYDESEDVGEPWWRKIVTYFATAGLLALLTFGFSVWRELRPPQPDCQEYVGFLAQLMDDAPDAQFDRIEEVVALPAIEACGDPAPIVAVLRGESTE